MGSSVTELPLSYGNEADTQELIVYFITIVPLVTIDSCGRFILESTTSVSHLFGPYNSFNAECRVLCLGTTWISRLSTSGTLLPKQAAES